jgi:hypothetical protein
VTDAPSAWSVVALLCDYAQVAEGKLFISGGGWSLCGPGPFVHSLAVKVAVPWDQANRAHALEARIEDEDGAQPLVGDPPTEVALSTQFEVGRPPGLPPGTALDMPFAVNLGPLELPPNRGYVWVLTIDGEECCRIPFRTRPA